jgi:dimethylargininase
MADFGVSSSVAPLQRVAVRPPSRIGDYAAAHWPDHDPDLLAEQHSAFVALLDRLGSDVVSLPAADGLPDAIFTYDPAFVIPSGTIQLRAAKECRTGENALLAEELQGVGVPIVGRLEGGATADGGDMFWLDPTTLAVGLTWRTNAEAVTQLRPILARDGVEVVTFDLANDGGPDFCLHLMSVISPVRDDLAVVYERLAPVSLLRALIDRGIEWVAVPDAEYASLGCNVLTMAPGVVVMTTGNPVTAQRLSDAGVDVHVYEASEINKGEGGPTCLTRPILRA